MDIVRDDLLAGPALAANQNREIGGRELLHLPAEVEHACVLGDDGRGELHEPAAQLDVFFPQPRALVRVLHGLQKLVEIKRLLHVVERPQLDRLYSRIYGRVRGDHDHGDPGVDCQEALEDINAALIGQHHVQKNDIDPVVGKNRDCLLAIGRVESLVTDVLEVPGQALAELLFIVDDQDAAFHLLIVTKLPNRPSQYE